LGIGTTLPVSDFEVTTSGLSAGDFVVDIGNKTVNVGRLSTTSGDNGKLFVRDRNNNGLTISGKTGADGTGLFRPDLNVMGISANGSEIARVTSSGVGIDTGGVASITELLTIGKKGGIQDNPDALSLGSSYSNTAGSPSRLKVKVYDAGGDNANGLGHSGGLMNIVSGISGHSMAFFTNGGGGSTERMRITSDGSVGIGTSSPDSNAKVTIDTGTDNGALFLNSTDGDVNFSMADNTGHVRLLQNGGELQFRVGGDANSFGAGDSEKVRIDSSGNVLVGKTAIALATVGGELRADGQITGTRSGGSPLILNRTTSDGEIAQFYKDAVKVGSISSSPNFNIQRESGAGFNFGTTNISPLSSGSLSDNTIDLGFSSYRWNDLYLGGNIYLGGTGSANALDDYEEGTWTPTVVPNTSGTVSLSTANGLYTKIGDFVYFEAYIAVSSISSPSGYFQIQGLPFISNAGARRAGSIVFFNSVSANVSDFMIYTNPSSDVIICVLGDGTTQQLDSANQITATTQMRVAISYRV
jgi:hypothetical protein